MMTLGTLTLPLSDIATLLGIVSALGGAAGTLLVLWLQTKFVRKPAYYHDKGEHDARMTALDKRMAAIELEHALFKAANMQRHMEALQTDIKTLTQTIDTLDKSLSRAMHDMDKRVFALEQKKDRAA